MDREEVAKHAGVIPAEGLAAFLEYLVRSPELPKVLDAPHITEERLQGDLVNRLPCVHLNEKGEAEIAILMVAVINNTCDLQPKRSRFVNVAPVFAFPQYRDYVIKSRGEKNAEGLLANIKNNKISKIFFVSECPGCPEGVVILLDRISSIGFALYEQALADKRRVASFTQNGFFVFLLKITKYLARAESPAVARVAV